MAFSYIPKHQGKHYQFLQFQLEAGERKYNLYQNYFTRYDRRIYNRSLSQELERVSK